MAVIYEVDTLRPTLSIAMSDQEDMSSTVIDTGEIGQYFNAKPTSDGGIIAVWENDSSGNIVLQKFDDFDCYCDFASDRICVYLGLYEMRPHF